MGKVKINEEQRKKIKMLYRDGNGISIRRLADMYMVSRSTIMYIVDPVYAERERERMKVNARLRSIERKK